MDASAKDQHVVPGLTDFRPLVGASDAEIDAATAEAGLLPLLMAVVHITGRLDILHEAGRTEPPKYSTDLSGSIPAERADNLRQHAARAIKAWRDAGCPPPVYAGRIRTAADDRHAGGQGAGCSVMRSCSPRS